MAAVLACAPDAALSHRSAAALWGFGEEHRAYIDVTVRRASEARLRGVRCHRRPTLPVFDVTVRYGIPLTVPVRTFLDLTTVAGPKTVERAINEADKLDVIDADSLRRALDGRSGELGSVRCERSSTSTPSGSPTMSWNGSSACWQRRPGCQRR